MKNLIITTIAAASLLAASLTVFAANERHLPDPRPDGKICQAVRGGIRGMKQDTGIAGVTYYTSTHKPTLDAALVITKAFGASLFDADGGYTTITFHNPDGPSESLPFSGTNNRWAQTYTVTQPVDSIRIAFPPTHPSTNLCMFEVAASAAVTQPTGINPTFEPAQVNHLFLAAVKK